MMKPPINISFRKRKYAVGTYVQHWSDIGGQGGCSMIGYKTYSSENMGGFNLFQTATLVCLKFIISVGLIFVMNWKMYCFSHSVV